MSADKAKESDEFFENVRKEDARPVADADVIGAIRLALVATTEQRTLRRVLDAILEKAAPTPESSAGSVSLLLDAVRATKADWKIRVRAGDNDSQ